MTAHIAHNSRVHTGFWLVCTLIFFAFVSFNLTLSTLATYLLTQFALRARTDGARPALASVYADARAQLSLGRARGRKRASRPLNAQTSSAAPNLRQDYVGPAEEGIMVSASALGKTESRDGDDTLVIVGVGEVSHSPSPSRDDAQGPVQGSVGATKTTEATFGQKVPGVPVDASA